MNAPLKTPLKASPSWWSENWRQLLVVAVLGLLPFMPVLLAGDIMFASDQMGSPAWKWYFDSLRAGEFPLWNPYILGGMPTYDGNAGAGLYVITVIMGFIFPVTRYITATFVAHALIAGFSAYVLTQRYFKLDRWIAAALAVAYMLNTNLISLMYGGHDGKVYVLSWLPLSLYFLLRALGPTATWRSLAGLGATITIFISTSHLQFTYFVLMGYFFVWLYFLVPALAAKRFREAGSLVLRYWVPVLLGMGAFFFMLYPPIQYNDQFSIRGAALRTTYEHATSWSIHPEETASLLVPEFGGINEKYWGRNYFKLNSEYPGVLVLFLGIAGLIAFRRKRWYWLWGGIGLLSIIYGLGAHTPLFRLFYEFVPGVKVFRAPSMMLFWLTVALLMMSAETLRRLTAVGADGLPDAARARLGKRIAIGGFSTAGFLVLLGLFPGAAYSVWNGLVDASQIPNLPNQPAAESDFGLGALRAAVLLAVLTWGAGAFLLKARRPAAFGVLALAVTVVDLYWIDSHFIQGIPESRMLQQDPVMDYFKTDTTRYRVFGLPGALEGLNNQYHGVETIEGRADHELRHYREFRGGEDYVNNTVFMATLRQNPDGSVAGSTALDLLNVKYIAFRVQNDPGVKLVLNASYLPRAFVVPQWKAVSDSGALQGIRAADFDPRRVAYITGEGLSSGGVAPDSGAPLIVAAETVRHNNRLTYSVDAPSGGVLVVSEIWFPHWQVKVDGKRAQALRTNFAFRGVLLEPGRHTVEFEYHSPWLRTGLWVSLLSVLSLAAFIVVWARFGKRSAKA